MVSKRLFLDEVVQNIRSKEAKKVVSKELNHHIEETKQKLIQDGKTPEEAEKMAVLQMGSPIQLGQRMDKIHRPKVDWFLIGLITVILGVGVLASIVLDNQSTDTDFLSRRIVYSVMGTIGLVLIMLFDYRKLKNKGWIFFTFGSVILLAMNLGWMTVRINGANFLDLGIFIISPSETLPLFLIAWGDFLQKRKFNLLIFYLMFLLPIMMYLPTNDFVTVVMYIVLLSVMVIVNNLTKKKMAVWISLAGTWVILIGALLISLEQYQLARIYAFLNPDKYANGLGYMYVTANELMGSAGWWGQESIDLHMLPLVHSSMIFVALTYTLGWLFAIVLVILLSLFLVRITIIYRQINDPFGKMLIVGSLSLFLIMVVGNIGMTLGLVPITSISLPFISYGFAPVVTNAALIGLILSVYRRKDLIRFAVEK